MYWFFSWNRTRPCAASASRSASSIALNGGCLFRKSATRWLMAAVSTDARSSTRILRNRLSLALSTNPSPGVAAEPRSLDGRDDSGLVGHDDGVFRIYAQL